MTEAFFDALQNFLLTCFHSGKAGPGLRIPGQAVQPESAFSH
jgi:hypothetical protein